MVAIAIKTSMHAFDEIEQAKTVSTRRVLHYLLNTNTEL